MYYKNIALVCASLLATGAIYAATPSATVTCPTPDAIKAVPFDDALTSRGSTNSWVGVIKKNNFGTETAWTFGFGFVTADSKEQALSLMSEYVQDIVFAQPSKGPNGEPVCVYSKDTKPYMTGVTFPAESGYQASQINFLLSAKA